MTSSANIPAHDQITEWLATHNYSAEWAEFLTGLPWKYIEPVVTIAAKTGNHPAIALTTAAQYSSDSEFKQVATAHLAAKDPAKPNRAQRRATDKRTRRRRP